MTSSAARRLGTLRGSAHFGAAYFQGDRVLIPPLDTPLSKARFPSPSLGLQWILFLCFVVVSTVPVSFLGFWVQQNSTRKSLQAVEERHLLLAKNLSGALSRYAMDLQAVFAAQTEAIEQVAGGDIYALLRTFNLKLFVCVQGDELLYKMGDASLLPETLLEPLNTHIDKAQRNPQSTVFSPIILNAQDVPTIYLLRVNQSGELSIAALTTEYFSQVQQAIAFGEKGHAAIVDQTGQAIAHPRADWQATAKDMSKISAVQAMLNRQTGVAQFYSPALDADMIAGYSFVPETGWGVMIPQPIAELEQAAQESTRVALLISLLGLAFAGIISWKLALMLTAPLQALMVASKQLSQGQTAETLGLNNLLDRGMVPRELDALLHAFNQMAEEVSQSRLNLQDKVAEQTRELREEIDERRRLETKLVQMANHDDLTGLPNRRSLIRHLEALLETGSHNPLSEEAGHATATFSGLNLLFLDLDGFKRVNDTFGHKVGDDLLVSVVQRIQPWLKPGDQFYRLGGDEFVITLPCDGIAERGQVLSETLIQVLKQPFVMDEQSIQIGCSIGIRKVDLPVSDLTADAILADADAAMYQAKAQRNCAVVFESTV